MSFAANFGDTLYLMEKETENFSQNNHAAICAARAMCNCQNIEHDECDQNGNAPAKKNSA